MAVIDFVIIPDFMSKIRPVIDGFDYSEIGIIDRAQFQCHSVFYVIL